MFGSQYKSMQFDSTRLLSVALSISCCLLRSQAMQCNAYYVCIHTYICAGACTCILCLKSLILIGGRLSPFPSSSYSASATHACVYTNSCKLRNVNKLRPAFDCALQMRIEMCMCACVCVSLSLFIFTVIGFSLLLLLLLPSPPQQYVKVVALLHIDLHEMLFYISENSQCKSNVQMRQKRTARG